MMLFVEITKMYEIGYFFSRHNVMYNTN